MRLEISVLGGKEQSFWEKEIRDAIAGIEGVALAAKKGEQGQIVFVAGGPDSEELLEAVDRKGRAVFLLLRDGDEAPESLYPNLLYQGKVDDILVHPFRKAELLARIHHYQQILMWDEVSQLNASFADLVKELREDLKLAERLQKAKLPMRFPEIRGFKVASRYLAGLKSGGDYFDLAESKDMSQISLVLTDSSTYGLSSAVLSVLVKVALKLSSDQVRSSRETVSRIYQELLATLSEKDQLSLFYGVISRKDCRLRYFNLGTSVAFYAEKGREFRMLPAQGKALTKWNTPAQGEEGQLELAPEGRLVVLSDGFIETAGSPDAALKLLNEFRTRDSIDAMNELVYQVKKKFKDEEDLPEQDCTAVAFDVDSRVLRLA